VLGRRGNDSILGSEMLDIRHLEHDAPAELQKWETTLTQPRAEGMPAYAQPLSGLEYGHPADNHL
jgi:hypothetical protein